MKYVDTEKLKAEIEKRAKFHNDAMKACTGLNSIAITHSAGWKEDTELLTIIDSLQQEQHEMDLVEQGITYKDKVMPTTDNSGNIDGYCLDGENEFAAVKAAVENGYLKVGDKVIIQIRKAE